jgi:uncharacterized membrane protein YfcA
MPSLEILVFAPLIVLLAYLIFGMTGFGSTLIAVPLLAHVMPLTSALPVVVVLDCIGAIGMGFKLRHNVWKAEFLSMLPFLLIGLFAGAYVLIKLPAKWLLFSLGCIVLLIGVNFLLNHASRLRLPRWSVAPVGVLAGTTSSAFGVGGPIYAFYFNGRGATVDQIRATIPAVFGFTSVARITIFGSIGLFNRPVLITAALLLPVMALGMWCGHRLHGKVSREQSLRFIGALVLLSGISLIARALAS